MINQTVTAEPNAEEINRTCDKLITEICSVKMRVLAIQSLTACCGPSIDAERHLNNAIKCLQRQKR